MSINNIEGQSKAELIKIIEAQQEHDLQREAYVKQLEQRNADLGKESKRESMELRSRLGSALGRNSELAERNKELEQRNAELERKVEAEHLKKEEFVKWVDNLIAEAKELREQRLRSFGEEEYIIFFDDGEDYPDSMVAPVVMSADKFRELFNAREQLRKGGDV